MIDRLNGLHFYIQSLVSFAGAGAGDVCYVNADVRCECFAEFRLQLTSMNVTSIYVTFINVTSINVTSACSLLSVHFCPFIPVCSPTSLHFTSLLKILTFFC
jgi:hypothetical protein